MPELVDRARRHARCAPGSGTPSSRRRWPRPTRSSAASTAATSTSATSGAPTPGCSRRCTRSPRSPSSDRPLVRAAGRLPALRAQRRDQLRGRRPRAAVAAVEAAYAGTPGAEIDHLDGLTVTTDDWWFNVRPSNTEPLLRLNVEGVDDATMARVRDDVLAADQEPTHGGKPMNLDPKLLEIIVCPDATALLEPVGRGAGLSELRSGLPGPRRHPGAARRRGPQAGLSVPDGHLVRRVSAGRRGRPGASRRTAARPRRVRRAGTPRGHRGRSGRRGRRRQRPATPLRPRAIVAAGPDSRLLRAVLEPWCPVPFVAWPGPGAARLGRRPRPGRRARARTGPTGALPAAVAEAVRRGCQVVVASPGGLAGRPARRGALVDDPADRDPRPARHRGRRAGVPRPGRARPPGRPRRRGAGPRRRRDRLLAPSRPRGQPRQDAGDRAGRHQPHRVGRLDPGCPRGPARVRDHPPGVAAAPRSPATPSTCCP